MYLSLRGIIDAKLSLLRISSADASVSSKNKSSTK